MLFIIYIMYVRIYITENFSTILKKVLIDRLLFTPPFQFLFLFGTTLLQYGDPNLSFREACKKFLNTLIMNWFVFVLICNAVLFYFIFCFTKSFARILKYYSFIYFRKVWTVPQLINYLFIPVNKQVYFANVVALFWNIWLGR